MSESKDSALRRSADGMFISEMLCHDCGILTQPFTKVVAGVTTSPFPRFDQTRQYPCPWCGSLRTNLTLVSIKQPI